MPPVVIKYSSYVQPVALSVVENAYKKTPLYGNGRRGNLLEEIGRKLDEKKYTTKDAQDSLRINGTSTGKNTRTCDWVRVETNERIEHKSGRMQYNHKKQRWSISFDGIKQHNYDVLILCAYTPFGCWWFEHDGQSNLQSQGSTRHWKNCQICAPCRITDINHAWDLIQKKIGQISVKQLGMMQWT